MFVTFLVRSALSPLSVNMGPFTVTGAISPVIVNVYTNRGVYTKGCYNPSTNSHKGIRPNNFLNCLIPRYM